MATTALEWFDALAQAGVLRGDSWLPWRAATAAVFGLDMTAAERAVYSECTNRAEVPDAPFGEAWLACGRRSGKSFAMAMWATYLSAFKDYRPYLGPGERATVALIAVDRRQARTLRRYISGLLQLAPLSTAVARETQETIDLKNLVTIEVHTASFRRTRGYTVAACLADEIAFWATSETATEPDYEVLNAIRPAMSTIPGSMLICASSPYARRGVLWESYQRYFGKDAANVLCWKAPTRVMNPTVPQSIIDRAMERDPASARAEYLAEFRSDVESFVSVEVVESCTERGVRERPFDAAHRYAAFVDPSGGSSDSMTMCIAHKEGDVVVIDAVREVVPPFNPDSVCAEFAAVLRSYRITTAQADRYGGAWVTERMRSHGVTIEPAALPASGLYQELLPRLNAQTIRLLDHSKLANQLVGLERRHGRLKDVIDHPPNGHDDIANVVAGVASLAAAPVPYVGWGTIGPDGKLTPHEDFGARRLRCYRRADGSIRLRQVSPN